MAYSYTNRQGKIHYFKRAETKKGGYRYYVTTSNKFPDLIDEVPNDYEVAELPEDAKVVIRKKKPVLITKEEREITHDAIKDFSAINDFFIHADEEYVYVYHSQFNYTAGQEPNLSREEANEVFGFGEDVTRWMRFFTSLRFKLVDKTKRLFQTERVVYTSFYGHDFHPVGEVGLIEDVARNYGQYLGRETFFDLEPKSYE
ncbi:hypothetical protein V9L05_12745 [Bernardetia sp. Wsw4-3y2]|uniref:hypothetical protein n=1 Tax=Bernardetia sp. Wsw4-3y2 TaxID=3127471 RepID=UPI0030CA9471